MTFEAKLNDLIRVRMQSAFKQIKKSTKKSTFVDSTKVVFFKLGLTQLALTMKRLRTRQKIDGLRMIKAEEPKDPLRRKALRV